MPVEKINSARSRISSFVTVLLMTRRRRSDPVSGSDRQRALAALFEQRHDGRRQVVEPQRGRADRIAHVLEAAQDVFDVGVIAQGDRHQAGARRVRPRRLRELEDPVGREGADRQVVVAGPAEPAQVRAAAHHFDEEAGAELGVGREDRGRRRIDGVGALQRGLANHRRRAGPFARHVARDGAVGAVLDVVETTARNSRGPARGAAAVRAATRCRTRRPARAPALRLRRRQSRRRTSRAARG